MYMLDKNVWMWCNHDETRQKHFNMYVIARNYVATPGRHHIKRPFTWDSQYFRQIVYDTIC